MNTPTESTPAANAALPNIAEKHVIEWLRAVAAGLKAAHPLVNKVELRLKNEDEDRFTCWATVHAAADTQAGYGTTVAEAFAMAYADLRKPEQVIAEKRAKLAAMQNEVAQLESQMGAAQPAEVAS